MTRPLWAPTPGERMDSVKRAGTLKEGTKVSSKPEQGGPLQAKRYPHRITNRSDSGLAAVVIVVVSSG